MLLDCCHACLAALQLLKQVTDTQAVAEQAAHTAHLERARALDMLPASLDVLRAVFGDRGPCVKPKSEVSWGRRHSAAHGSCCVCCVAQLR